MKREDRIKEFLVIGAIIICTIKNISEISTLFSIPDMIGNIMLFLSYLMLSIKILYDGVKIKDIKKYIFLLGIGIIVYIVSKQPSMITLYIFVIAMKDINLKKIVKIMFYINFFTIVIHMILYFIYYLLDFESLNIITRSLNNGESIRRYAFFFVHPNTFASYVFWTTCMYIYAKDKKMDVYTSIKILVIAIFIYYVPNSRTTAISLVIMVMIFLLRERNIIKNKVNVFACIGMFFALSLIGIMFYDNSIIRVIDKFITGRIGCAYAMEQVYGINLFGAPILLGIKQFVGNGLILNNFNSVDSFYYSLMINSGIISTVVFLYFIWKLNKKISIKDSIFLLIFGIFSLFETSGVNPVLGFPLLFLKFVI